MQDEGGLLEKQGRPAKLHVLKQEMLYDGDRHKPLDL